MKNTTILCAIVISMLPGCQPNSNTENRNAADMDSNNTKNIELTENEIQRIDDLINSIGPPIEFIYILNDLDIKFSQHLLFPSKDIDKYHSSIDQGLIMGLLSADFIYCLLYQRSDLAAEYLEAIKIMAKELDMDNAIDFEGLNKLYEKDMNANDMALEFTRQMENVYAHLMSRKQMNLSAAMSFGAWLECMYIAVVLGENLDQNSEELIDLIYYETLMSQTFLDLFKKFGDFPGYPDITKDLTELKNIYSAFEVVLKEEKPRVTYADSMTQAINLSTQTLKYNLDQQKQLTDKIIEIRTHLLK